MSKDRDYINEIILKRTRLKPNTHRMRLVWSRIDMIRGGLFYLEENLSSEMDFKRELMKYGPIGAVACMEGYFRLFYKDLIDYGPPYSDNIAGFKDSIRFNIQSVMAIQGSRVSLGEFISHLLPLNNLEDINKNTSTIIGEDFLARLKITPEEPGGPPVMNAPYVFKAIKKLFELRHVYCHELGAIKGWSLKRIRSYVDAALIFIMVTEYLANELMPEV